MIVEIKIIRDDGAVVYSMVSNAVIACGWSPGLAAGPIIGEKGEKLPGFTYLPVPPPRDPLDMAEFRRLFHMHFPGEET